jgi:hypothetical protein
MRLLRLTLPIVLCLPIGFAQQTPILFEGARLVNGDGSVTENSAFVIANEKFTSVGKSGANPFDYLAELQRHSTELASNPSAWMPWNYSETLARMEV